MHAPFSMPEITDSPKLREYNLLVKPPREARIRHTLWAASASEAKKQALKRWPESNVLITEVHR
jgi:hypothetical protein